jgi:hypothetical protein
MSMTAEAILRRALELGIRLEVAGDRIRYAPKSIAPEDFVASLREHKPEILRYLSGNRQRSDLEGEPGLLAWAAQLAEENTVLDRPVEFVEAPLRVITTTRVSHYAAQYLKTISRARLEQPAGGWGIFTPQWWREREEEALGALASLRQAMAEAEAEGDQ